MKQYIPNSITLLNLFCGCCAIVALLHDQIAWTLILLALGITADYLDGMAARALQVKSLLGKELDSLADLVSFGVLPGMMLYYLLEQSVASDAPGQLQLTWRFTPAFLLTLFAALRLAKFNLDIRQTDDFLGLPTPSATVFVAGLLAMYHYDSLQLSGLIANRWFLYLVIGLLCWLLVSEIPMFSLKFTKAGWRGNELKIGSMLLALLLLLLLGPAAPALIILLYVLFNLLRRLLRRQAM